jgi:hypothetical protein
MLDIDSKFLRVSIQAKSGLRKVLKALRLGPKFAIFVLLPAMLLTLQGCHYFKIAATTTDGTEVDGAVRRDKYIVVHTDNGVWHLSYPEVDKTNSLLTGKMTPLGIDHEFYKLAKRRHGNRYKYRSGDPSTEVHLYINEYSVDSLNFVVIPLDGIKRLDVYGKEKGKTIVTYVVGIAASAYVGFVAVILLILLIIYS